MRRKGWTVVLISVLTAVLVSRGSFYEIADYDIVSGVAVDRTGEEWLVTCEICTPSPDGDFGSHCDYVEGRGATLEQAFSEARRASANLLYTAAVQLYIIAPELCKNEELYAYFLDSSVNHRAVAVFAQGRAAKVFSQDADSDNTRARSLAIAKKVRRSCREEHLPLPRVTEYLKGGTLLTVSASQIPAEE